MSMWDQLGFVFQQMESSENQLMGSDRTTLVDVLSFCLLNSQYSLHVSKEKNPDSSGLLNSQNSLYVEKVIQILTKYQKRGYVSKLFDDTHSILNIVQFFLFFIYKKILTGDRIVNLFYNCSYKMINLSGSSTQSYLSSFVLCRLRRLREMERS